jgi:hypothetical protein
VAARHSAEMLPYSSLAQSDKTILDRGSTRWRRLGVMRGDDK